MKHEVDQVVGAELGDGLEQYVDLEAAALVLPSMAPEADSDQPPDQITVIASGNSHMTAASAGMTSNLRSGAAPKMFGKIRSFVGPA